MSTTGKPFHCTTLNVTPVGPWVERALCSQVDPELFYPLDNDKGGASRQAKKVCTDCPVATACLEYALENNEQYGVWGGMSERERRNLRRRMANAS